MIIDFRRPTPRPFRRLLLAAGLVTVLARPAVAGIELTLDTSRSPGPGHATKAPKHRSVRAFLDPDRLRLDAGEGDPPIVYRADRDVFVLLHDKEHAYTEIDRTSVKRVQDGLDAVTGAANAVLEKLPPEKRAQIEQMLGAHGMSVAATPATPREPITLRPTGRTDRVAGRPCRETEMFRGARQEADLCVADWAAAGVTRNDFAVLKRVAAWQSQMQGSIARAGWRESSMEIADALAVLDRGDGVPLRIRGIEHGARTWEVLVTDITRKALPPALFAIPAGYTPKPVLGALREQLSGRAAP